jgi:TolB-like protein/Flp pilus assembly protein TadD
LILVTAGGASWWYAGQPGLQEMTSAAPDSAAEAKPALPLPDRPSIAVLPFDNLSGDPKQERLAGGLTEDVITDLSRFRELFVIARNSTEVYKGKPVDVREVARDLGVQYVLEGSLQIDGDRVRITAQLIDGATGKHVWAERYGRLLDDVFVVQDEVIQKIAGALAPSMGGVLTRVGRESARRKPPDSLQAYENYLLGIEHKHRFTQEDNQKAQELLTKATELDPGLARAYVGLAAANLVAIDNGWTPSRQHSLDNVLKALRTAISLDPADNQAHHMLGTYYLCVGDLEHSLAEEEKALSLNPNDADVLALAAWNMPWFGRPEQATELADRALRLNPNQPDWYNPALMCAYFYAGQYERALAVTRGRLNPETWDYIYRPLIYAHLDRKADAATAVSELLQRDPNTLQNAG